MRVSEIFEAVVAGAAGKAGLVAAGGDVAPGRTESAFESVLVGLGPADLPAAWGSGQAVGSEAPRPPRMAATAPAGSLAAESAGARASEGPIAAAEPLSLPVPVRVPVGVAAVQEEALAEALALRRQAEAGAEATIAPPAGLAAGPPLPISASVALRAVAAGESPVGHAMPAAAALPGSLPNAAETGAPLPEAALPMPGNSRLSGHVGQEDAAAGWMAPIPWPEPSKGSPAAPSVALVAPCGAGIPAPGAGSGSASGPDPDLPPRAASRSPDAAGAELVAAPGEPARRPAGPEPRGTDAATGAPPLHRGDAPTSAAEDLSARWRAGAAVPELGLGVGMPAEAPPSARFAVAPEPIQEATAPGDRAPPVAAPVGGAVLEGEARDRAAETIAPALQGSVAARGRGIASGPVRADGAAALAGPPSLALAPELGSAGPAASSEPARAAVDGGLGREVGASALPPGAGPGASPGAPPAAALAPLAAAAHAPGSGAGSAEAGRKEASAPAAAPHRAAARVPEGAPVAFGAEAALPSEPGAAGAGPGGIPELPPATAQGFGEAQPGMRDAAAAPHAAPEARAETGARAAQQVAAALTASPEGRIELRLDPEELGLVRLGLAPGEGTITVQIAAERGETLELLRRHADLLARELRQAGYGDVSFQFGADTASGGGAAPRHGYAPAAVPEVGEEARSDPVEVAPAQSPPVRRGLPAGALDLRL